MNTAYWQQQFSQQQGAEPLWLSELRLQAFTRWQQQGFPTQKQERWKYTELMPLTQTAFSSVAATEVKEEYLPALLDNSLRIIIAGGKIVHNDLAAYSFSLEEALLKKEKLIQDLLNAQSIDSIDDLNQALTHQGLLIHLPAKQKISQPIHIIYLDLATDASMLHQQQFIILEEGASATIIEHHVGKHTHQHFSTVITHAKLAAEANLHFHRWQEQAAQTYHINRLYLTQETGSLAYLFNLDLSGRLVRNETLQIFAGETATCHLSGLYLGRGKQQIDNYISLHHQSPLCTSSQFYKGILDDRAHGVFGGKVIVAKDAQKTDASQHNANLILSTQAEIDTQPQLEIYADDVKCAHGATVGQLDEDALFYLQARGLPLDLAKELLIYSFAAEALEHIQDTTLRAYTQQLLGSYFPALHQPKEVEL